jgi:hypothetical protein
MWWLMWWLTWWLLQTVVLQHYEELADKMHEIVGSLNAFIERGDIDKLHTEQLHRCCEASTSLRRAPASVTAPHSLDHIPRTIRAHSAVFLFALSSLLSVRPRAAHCSRQPQPPSPKGTSRLRPLSRPALC